MLVDRQAVTHTLKRSQEKKAPMFALQMRVTRFTKSSPEMNSRISLVKSRSLPAWVTSIFVVVIFFRKNN